MWSVLVSRRQLLRAASSKRGQQRWFRTARNKVVSVQDAVSSVHNGDVIVANGFAAQGVPELLLEALGKRFAETGEPRNLTLLFHGSGDYESKGLDHLATPGPDGSFMLKRMIGSFYGQTPRLAELALNNSVEAHNLPLGSISRMIRATAMGCPGHLTRVGMGTFIDPDVGNAGRLNEKAANTDFVHKVQIFGKDYLMYKALPIHVGFIRGTTGDTAGNITMEHESLLVDNRIIANAAHAGGGIVVAQVKRLAQAGSLPAREVHVPGIMVDSVVVVPDEKLDTHHMQSFFMRSNPSWSQERRVPLGDLPIMPLNERKVISRRASMKLRTGNVVNLGIGMAEGIASVANEEGCLQLFTLTTEAGAVGGVPAGRHNFGPSANADALQELNEQFDFYNGGGLDVCFLGSGQVASNGDVNVHRVSKKKLTGVGGFMDITQCTDTVVFVGTFTAQGLKVRVGDGKLEILQEGKTKKFKNEVDEKTFSGDIAMTSGQSVTYITERCVFKRFPEHPTLMLTEIAPGVDLEKDILAHMEFRPVISDKLKQMDPALFKDELFGLRDLLVEVNMDARISWDEASKTCFVDLKDLRVATEEDVAFLKANIFAKYEEYFQANGSQKFAVAINYDGFDCADECATALLETTSLAEETYYASVRRYSGHAFLRQKLGQKLGLVDPMQLWEDLDINQDGVVSPREFVKGMRKVLDRRISQEELEVIFGGEETITKEMFPKIYREHIMPEQ